MQQRGTAVASDKPHVEHAEGDEQGEGMQGGEHLQQGDGTAHVAREEEDARRRARHHGAHETLVGVHVGGDGATAAAAAAAAAGEGARRGEGGGVGLGAGDGDGG